MKRVATAELLDTDSGTPAEIATSLADLRMINRWFGGISSSRSLIRHVAARLGSDSLSLLEVAAGTGATPQAMQQDLDREGIRLDITLLDRARSHLIKGDSTFSRITGDALALPFEENTFDLVTCSLFVHHLSPEQVEQFVNEALRVCRAAVVINDLVRHPVHLALVYAGVPLFRSRITRHDAPASVRQSYTPDEMRAILAKTTVARVEIQRYYLFRMGLIAWKKA
jgi:ubiquinone/menaquinone biosynthesis C-methylase UbiE